MVGHGMAWRGGTGRDGAGRDGADEKHRRNGCEAGCKSARL